MAVDIRLLGHAAVELKAGDTTVVVDPFITGNPKAEVLRAAGAADPDERIAAVRTLIAEETRVSMLIGVAVGYELARQLERGDRTNGS